MAPGLVVSLLVLSCCQLGFCWNDLDAIGFNYTVIDTYIEWCKKNDFPCNFELVDYLIRGFGVWLCILQSAMLIINWYEETPSAKAKKVGSTEDARGLGSMEPLSPTGFPSAEARLNNKYKSIEQVTAVPNNPSSEMPSREGFRRQASRETTPATTEKTTEKTMELTGRDPTEDISPEGVAKGLKSEDRVRSEDTVRQEKKKV